ncbi:MAG: 4'-phosphopantetheinyl transferase superfamily protein [Lachnospiraceae bacterium]|nr:4'-phosphopantetheinyl transferase superfamily protein [Lachnospiraceae bacterium]
MGIVFKLYMMTTEPFADPEVFAQYYRNMPKERQKKIDKTRMEQDKKLSLAAGILLDLGLKKYGLNAVDTQICAGEYGKPYLPDYPEIHFSLSHSKEMALAVFSEMEIGCDIEYQKKPNEHLARRFYCPQEYAWMQEAADEEERKTRFYRLWTLKESFIKTTGMGLRLPLDSFCFSFGEEASGFQPESRQVQMERYQCKPVRKSGLQEMECDIALCESEYAARSERVKITQQYEQARYEFSEYCFGENGAYCAAVCLRQEGRSYGKDERKSDPSK